MAKIFKSEEAAQMEGQRPIDGRPHRLNQKKIKKIKKEPGNFGRAPSTAAAALTPGPAACKCRDSRSRIRNPVKEDKGSKIRISRQCRINDEYKENGGAPMKREKQSH